MSPEPLFQLNVLADFIKLILWTGQLSDERPASAIIVAPPGAGKTSLLESFECEQAKFIGDLTARPLHGILKNEKLTHLMLGDMLAIFGHKKSTVDLTLQNIAKMTGEKIKQDPWTGDEIAPRMIGMITAIPPADLKSKKISQHINAGGFASRFLIIRYNYKKSTVASIHRFIADNRYSINFANTFTIKNPARLKVEIPAKIADKIKDLAVELKSDPLGFRAHRYLRSLVKAQARRNERQIASEEDFKLIEQYCDFFAAEGREI